MSRRFRSAAGRPSRTAELAAAHRAYHLLEHSPTLLEDSDALWLLGQPARLLLRWAPLRRLLVGRLVDRVRPISVWVVVRSRYTEDCLQTSVREGCRQYVILGAGLDSWALRNPGSEVAVFELDHPATQHRKEARIRSRLGDLPPGLTLAPIDLERDSIAETLARTSFDREARALVSWLGTLCYLTREAIETTLASLASVCAPGSRLVFDYFLPRSTMSPADLALFEDLDRALSRRGEPMLTLLDCGELSSILEASGFRIVEDLAGSEIRQRYLRDRTDGLDVPDFARLCCAQR